MLSAGQQQRTCCQLILSCTFMYLMPGATTVTAVVPDKCETCFVLHTPRAA